MSWICGILPTFFSYITSFFSKVFCSICGHSEDPSVVTVDLELGGVGSGSKVMAKSASFDERPVHLLKVREVDSPRTTLYVPNPTPEKIEPRRTIEEDPRLGALAHNTYDISTAIDRASSPSSESVSDDDCSSFDHSLESSAGSFGDRAKLDSASQSDASHSERQKTRDEFYENCGATRSTQFDSIEVAEDGVGEGKEWEGHPEMLVDDELAETIFEVARGSGNDESTFEEDPNIPSHRWLKFAIEFVWQHKLLNTIKETEEDEGMGDVIGVSEAEHVDLVNQVELLARVPELIEHAPTPPPEDGQEIIVDASLCRVREVTEDLVDLLASLKVAFPDSPSSMCTTFTCNKSDNPHDTRTASPSYDPVRSRPGREIDPEVCQWLRPTMGGSEVNLGHIHDDLSMICATGCRSGSNPTRPLSAGRFSPF